MRNLAPRDENTDVPIKSDVDAKAADNTVVKLTGNQAVAGVKTFSASPVVPTPTTDMQAATKKYVDDNAGAMSAAEILDAIKTVDGASSGLDADLLDGQHASAFASSYVAQGNYLAANMGNSGSTKAIPNEYPALRVTLTANCTFTFDFPLDVAGRTFLLYLSGNYTPTFPASVDWDGGVAPTYASPSLYGFTTLDGGTTWLGTLIASGLG